MVDAILELLLTLSLILSGILAYLLFSMGGRRNRHALHAHQGCTVGLREGIAETLRPSRKLANRLKEAIWQKF
jgi:hypothetical protein